MSVPTPPSPSAGSFARLVEQRGLLYGADYNPEQWPAATWREDAELMVRAGVNLVTVGVFSWSVLEPRPDAYDFGWLDDVLDLLHEHGIAVDLATPTASPPPWLGVRWPDALSVTRDGVRMSHGSRNHFCPSSPAYRDRCRRIVTALVERYAGHPAVAMWHIGNEFGQVCHCDHCAVAFRRWLQQRHGDLDGLNAAWGTAFWSQRYGDWDEVIPPRAAPYLINPSQELDFRRFASDALLEVYLEQQAIIRDRDASTPVTTNFMGLFPLVDYRRWAPHLDLVADDSYPDPDEPADAVATGSSSVIGSALSADLMRTLGADRGWMLMEQATTAVNWREHNVAKTPGRLRREAFQAIARGADGCCYFQWRASPLGSERFHAALVPPAGADTLQHRAVVALGAELAGLRAVVGQRPTARVALLFDWDSWWAGRERALPSARLQPAEQLRRWYDATWRRGVLTDVCGSTDELGAYDVVLVPSAFLLDDAAQDRLRRFVADGGRLVLGPFSGVVDADGRVRTGRFPVGLRDVIGVSGEQWLPLPTDAEVSLSSAALGDAAVSIWSELLAVDGAEVLGTFDGGPVDGGPAVTRHDHGAGAAWYVGTVLGPEQLDAVIVAALREAGVDVPAVRSDGIEIVDRGDLTFMINHGARPATVDLPVPRTDLLTGLSHDRQVPLGPDDVVVLTAARP